MSEMAGRAGRPGNSSDHLTAREIEVLLLVAADLHNHQIARRLGISSRTVDQYLVTMLRRAGVGSRTGLVACCYGLGILYGWPPAWSGKIALRL